MACDPQIYIEGLRVLCVLDESLEADGGLLVTAAASADVSVFPAGTTGQVLSYNSTIASPNLEWVAQAASGAPSYLAITAFPAAAIEGTRDVVTIDASGEGAGSTTNIALDDGTVDGATMIIKVKGIAGGGATIVITPATALLGGSSAIEFLAVAQGVQLVWTATEWASIPGGATFLP